MTTTPHRTSASIICRGVGRRVLVAVVAVVAIGAAVSCGPSTSSGPTGTEKPAAAPAAAAPAALTTLDGKQLAVPGPVLTALFFFSVGCGECAAGAKSFAKAATDTSGGKAAFLAVDMDPSDSPQKVANFLRQVGGATLSAVIDKDAALTGRYHVAALSTLIVVDPAGKVTYRATDPPADQITTALQRAGAR